MTTASSPGKSFRKGITLMDACRMFDTEEKAETWFVSKRWPNGVTCPNCGSDDIATVKTRKPQPFRCRTCRKHFSVKTGTLMHSAKIPLSKWAVAFYLYATKLKGVSSMKLHRDLGIRQASAWYMAHRIRGMWGEPEDKFAGSVEADETYIGGKEDNKHEDKKLKQGMGTVGKTAVAGVKDRVTNQVDAKVVERTDGPTLRGFVHERTERTATVYTDDAAAYHQLNRHHEVVAHGVGKCVRGQAHTNEMESFWSPLKRGYIGTYHHFSVKHLDRYVNEFEGRHNARPMDTIDQMAALVSGSDGKLMTYDSLVNPETGRLPGF